MPSYSGLGVITVTGQIADGVITGAKLADPLTSFPSFTMGSGKIATLREIDLIGIATLANPLVGTCQIYRNTTTGRIEVKYGDPENGFAILQNDRTIGKAFGASGLVSVGMLVDSEIAAGAAIAKSKIATAATWALADLPALTQRASTQNTGRTISTTSTSFVNLATLTITPTSATNVCIVHGGVNGINNSGANSTFIRVAFGANNGPANGINQTTTSAGQASPADVVGIFKDQAAALTTVAFQWRVSATTGSTVFSGTADESDYVEVGIVQN